MLLRRLGDTDPQLQHNKVVDLQLAVPHLHGLLIPPGGTLSIWRRVGRPTAAQGYLAGVQLCRGQITVGIGGGLCQFANLIHRMGLHSRLELLERHTVLILFPIQTAHFLSAAAPVCLTTTWICGFATPPMNRSS